MHMAGVRIGNKCHGELAGHVINSLNKYLTIEFNLGKGAAARGPRSHVPDINSEHTTWVNKKLIESTSEREKRNNYY